MDEETQKWMLDNMYLWFEKDSWGDFIYSFLFVLGRNIKYLNLNKISL